MPLVALAGFMATVMVVSPLGATGEQRRTTVVAEAADVYSFGRDAVVSAPVSGNMQVVGGSADIQDVVRGDLIVLGGSVLFSGRGRVEGNVIYAGGRIRNADGRVGGRVFPLASLEGASLSVTKTAVAVSLLLLWLIGAVVVTLLSGREVRFSSVEMRASALHCFVLGLVAITSFVLTALIFSYLVPYLVGVPLLVGLGVFAILTKIYGMIAVFHAVGSIVARPRTRQQLAERGWRRGDLAMVVIGVLILGAIRLVPGVGPLVWSAASVFGVGVALATRFGRREPWFLAWRAMEA